VKAERLTVNRADGRSPTRNTAVPVSIVTAEGAQPHCISFLVNLICRSSGGNGFMKRRIGVAFVIFCGLLLSAQQPKLGVLSNDVLKKVVPGTYFFRGESAPVQLRNSAGFSVPDGKLVLTGLVDTSGYAADVQAKYQGFLITEVKLNIEGSDLAPGEYGFGFSKDGKFLVMDVGANDLFSVAGHIDDKKPHPVPLNIVEDGEAYRLYIGRKWVGLKPE
jgi:hypothetical protein